MDTISIEFFGFDLDLTGSDVPVADHKTHSRDALDRMNTCPLIRTKQKKSEKTKTLLALQSRLSIGPIEYGFIHSPSYTNLLQLKKNVHRLKFVLIHRQGIHTHTDRSTLKRSLFVIEKERKRRKRFQWIFPILNICINNHWRHSFFSVRLFVRSVKYFVRDRHYTCVPFL